MERKIFNKLYAKYFKKDYFILKHEVREKLQCAKDNNISVTYKEVKNYLKSQREKTFIFLMGRLAESKKGVKYPQREKITNEFIKALQ